ncbi:hypothetical protein Tco_0641658 [Tanacetum coccineum]
MRRLSNGPIKYWDKHNQVGFFAKPERKAGLLRIVDFLKVPTSGMLKLRIQLSIFPVNTVWQTATTNTKADGTLEINATIDTIGYTITEVSIRDTLQLADATGITIQEHDRGLQSQPSSSTPPVPSTSSPLVQSPPPIPASIPTPIPIPETEPEPFEHTFEEPSPVH